MAVNLSAPEAGQTIDFQGNLYAAPTLEVALDEATLESKDGTNGRKESNYTFSWGLGYGIFQSGGKANEG